MGLVGQCDTEVDRYRIRPIAVDAIRTVIRYTFTQTSEEEASRVSGLITVSLASAREECALDYLVRRYPNRYNIKLTEVVYL